MYPAFDWSVAPGHHGYQRACELISGQASRAIWVTSVRMRREDRTSISSQSLADLGMTKRGSAGYQLRDLKLASFELSTACQHAPGDASQLVGECDRKNVVV